MPASSASGKRSSPADKSAAQPPAKRSASTVAMDADGELMFARLPCNGLQLTLWCWVDACSPSAVKLEPALRAVMKQELASEVHYELQHHPEVAALVAEAANNLGDGRAWYWRSGVVSCCQLFL